MKGHATFLLLVCLIALGPAGLLAESPETNAVASRRFDMRFGKSAPDATPMEATRRFGLRSGGRAYTLASENFQVIVPGAFSTNVTWGLLVWISPGDTPGIPAAWEAELAKQRLLLVGAYKAGNARDVLERARLALDATYNMRQMYRIDPRRVYLGGFSGGGRVAGMVGMGYPEVFSGTICMCGVSFYTDIPTTTGEHWPRSFNPEAGRLAQAKGNRFVLLTGDQDINRENTHEVWRSGFEREGFRHVRYLEVPGQKHTLPSPSVLGTALEFLTVRETP